MITERQTGAMTTMSLFVIMVFGLVLMTTLAFIARQANSISVQEQEELAFGAADAGVEFVSWLLSSPELDYDVRDLRNLNLSNKDLRDPDSGDVEARYSILTRHGNDCANVVSIGRSSGRDDICQIVEATLDNNGSVAVWSLQPGNICSAATPMVPSGCDIPGI